MAAMAEQPINDPEFGNLLYARTTGVKEGLCVGVLALACAVLASRWLVSLPVAGVCLFVAAAVPARIRFFERGVERIGVRRSRLAYKDVSRFRFRQIVDRMLDSQNRRTTLAVTFTAEPRSGSPSIRFRTISRERVPGEILLYPGWGTEPLEEVAKYIATQVPQDATVSIDRPDDRRVYLFGLMPLPTRVQVVR